MFLTNSIAIFARYFIQALEFFFFLSWTFPSQYCIEKSVQILTILSSRIQIFICRKSWYVKNFRWYTIFYWSLASEGTIPCLNSRDQRQESVFSAVNRRWRQNDVTWRKVKNTKGCCALNSTAKIQKYKGNELIPANLDTRSQPKKQGIAKVPNVRCNNYPWKSLKAQPYIFIVKYKKISLIP